MTKTVVKKAAKKIAAGKAENNCDVVKSIGQGEQRQKQIESILSAVAIRIRSLGGSAVIQPHVVDGHYAMSLIVGDRQEDVIHLHAAESVGVQVVTPFCDDELRRQFLQQLEASKDLVRVSDGSVTVN